jgi:hypothetical protein
MTSVLAQVDHYTMCSRKLGKNGGGNRVRVGSQPGLPNCGHMIDIDGESGHFAPQCKN